MNIVQIYKLFPTEQDCINHLEQVRWGGIPTCPYCLSVKSTPRSGGKRHQCNHCNASYSVTVGTAFHKTRMSFHQWFLMMALMMNALKSLSARQMARDIGVTKDTAHLNMMKLRDSMIENEWMNGIIEMDETLIGGKNKNRQGSTLKPVIYSYVEKDSTVMTDEHTGYKGLSKYYDHQTVNHGVGNYVTGNTHTNSIEGEWSLFKRGWVGQWHNISDKFMNKYLDEFSFRANNRGNPEVFSLLLQKSLRV